MTSKLVDLFRWYAIPPSPIHEAVQEAARQAGWTPPWDKEEQIAKKKAAGKKSGTSRVGLTQMRRSLLTAARTRLKPQHRKNPYANESIDALIDEYEKLFSKEIDSFDLLTSIMLKVLSEPDRCTLSQVSRETIWKDLKELRSEKLKTLGTPSSLFPKTDGRQAGAGEPKATKAVRKRLKKLDIPHKSFE
jgi:hypothetical protein